MWFLRCQLRAVRLLEHFGAWRSLELLFPPTVGIKALGLYPCVLWRCGKPRRESQTAWEKVVLRMGQDILGLEAAVEIRVTWYLCFGKKGKISLKGVFMVHR